MYTGRILRARRGTLLHIPKSHKAFIVRTTLPRPLSPVNLITSSTDGPYPNLFHHSSITKNITFCFSVIHKSNPSCNSLGFIFDKCNTLVTECNLLQNVTLVLLLVLAKYIPPHPSFPGIDRGGVPYRGGWVSGDGILVNRFLVR